MGVPKRRVSHARQGERRSHLAIGVPTLEECSHCHEMKLPHHVCPNCGYYQGRLAVQTSSQSTSSAIDRAIIGTIATTNRGSLSRMTKDDAIATRV